MIEQREKREWKQSKMVSSAMAPWCTHHGWVKDDHACPTREMSPEDEATVIALLEGVTVDAPAKLLHGHGQYCGQMTYEISGWEIDVFNDCDEWDYIAHVRAPDGREWTFPFEPDPYDAMTERVSEWHPTGFVDKVAMGVTKEERSSLMIAWPECPSV